MRATKLETVQPNFSSVAVERGWIEFRACVCFAFSCTTLTCVTWQVCALYRSSFYFVSQSKAINKLIIRLWPFVTLDPGGAGATQDISSDRRKEKVIISRQLTEQSRFACAALCGVSLGKLFTGTENRWVGLILCLRSWSKTFTTSEGYITITILLHYL